VTCQYKIIDKIRDEREKVWGSEQLLFRSWFDRLTTIGKATAGNGNHKRVCFFFLQGNTGNTKK
jgi:hypothetical protein